MTIYIWACVSKSRLWPATHELEIDSICVALRNIRSADTLNRGKLGSLSNWAYDGEQGFKGKTNYLVFPLKIHGCGAPFCTEHDSDRSIDNIDELGTNAVPNSTLDQ